MSDDAIQPDSTFAETLDWLAARVHEGVHCPTCGQFAKVYRRKLNERIARVLIQMYKQAGTNWVYLPTLGGTDKNTNVPAARSGEHAFAAHWGLIERNAEEGGRGHWRITEHGRAFILNTIKIPKYARIYDGALLDLDDDEQVSIVDVLGTRWNYEEMMRGE